MTVPQEYWRASKDFEAFMTDLKAISMLATHNQCHAMLRAVLHVFRSHLEVAQALAFASVLPPVLRAIFVEDWQDLTFTPFPDDHALQAEVMAVRPHHNFSTDTAISDVARALRRHVDENAFDRALADLPEPARRFWLS